MWISFLFVVIALNLIFLASQLFWVRRLGELSERLIPSRPWRRRLGRTAGALYLFFLFFSLLTLSSASDSARLTFRAALLYAPFGWWFVSSMLGFGIAVMFGIADRLARAVVWLYRAARGATGERPIADPPSPGRRRFLEQTALAASAAPFFAGAYGLFYGRLNLETTHRRIKLARLPKAFEGFRIAQLSDLHIGSFMTAEEIGKYVALTNELKPDLILLTGDYVTWDAATQGAVVNALAGLKAPFGVFGCLGNHEIYSETEDSITRLFAARGIPILRQARVPIQVHGDALNLLGVDFQSLRGIRSHPGHMVRRYLEGMESLVERDTVNILLSHNPNSFDRAAELAIDLTLAGHTHGGQVTLEFIHPSLSPGRLVTPYVQGWFEKAGAQLYVNRGIGTIGVPIRINARPEITVFELARS